MIDLATSQNGSPLKQWYTIEEVAELCGWCLRTARSKIQDVPQDLITTDRAGVGRAKNLYHYTSHPALFSAYEQLRKGKAAEPTAPVTVDATIVDARGLAIASLRLAAVLEYLARCYEMTEAQAAVATCSEWSRSPRIRTVKMQERVGRRLITRTHKIKVGGFSKGTLRRWCRIYKDNKQDLASLAPQQSGRDKGRPTKQVPAQLLDLIEGLSVSTARADVEKSIRVAKNEWPGEWPEVSDRTLVRRIQNRDPHKRNAALGKRGIAHFRNTCSPDIERDRSKMRYNEMWELDDFRKDWYAIASDYERIVRPYCYGIMRASTRQWIFAIATEVPIPQDQVRTMVGLALASKSCGIPEEITFERGTIACDEYLHEQLELLGIKVHRTSMDDGQVYEGAIPDKAVGHPKGKAVVESNIGRLHGFDAFEPSNVGPEERHTSPARVQTMKALALKSLKEEGKPILLPLPEETQAKVFAAMERANNAPHSGLPETIDPESGATRHMTPNEYAQVLGDQAIEVMDEQYLPLFFEKSVEVPVTRNGIKLNGQWYGRFDDDLHDLTTVKAYALKDVPEVCYCQDLGRCLEQYDRERYGKDADQFGKKMHAEKRYRNQYEQLIARFKESPRALIDASRSMSDPTPDRVRTMVRNETLTNRVKDLNSGIRTHKTEKAARDKRFDLDGIASPAKSGKRGLLSREEQIESEMAVLSDSAGHFEEEDPFSL